MEVDELVALLRDDDRTAVVDGLAALTEAERKKLGPKVRGWLTPGTGNAIQPDRIGLAVLATAGGVRQALTTVVHLYSPQPAYVEEVVELFRRPPTWLKGFVNGLVEDGVSWHWRTAQALVVAGLARRHPAGRTRRASRSHCSRPQPDALDVVGVLIGQR